MPVCRCITKTLKIRTHCALISLCSPEKKSTSILIAGNEERRKKKKEGRKDREGCVRLIPGWSAVKENSNGRFYKRRGGRLKEIRRRRGRREIVGEGEKRGPR